MRAKEYIALHSQDLKYVDILEVVLADLLPLRANRKATDLYIANRLSADIRYQHYLLQKSLYETGNAMQQAEPQFEKIEDEIAIEIVKEVRYELFQVICEDASFGYLYYVLGTEQNARQNSDPIDCIPNEERILKAIQDSRDDYPQTSLDGFINDDLNYQQYCLLQDGNYLTDTDETYLAYFNKVYEIFDELRIRQQSISSVRSFLRSLTFDSEAEQYWIYAYVVKLIESYDCSDSGLDRCKQELLRLNAPLASTYAQIGTATTEKSPVYLNARKGNKIDFIRVLNALYEMGKFSDSKGERISKKEFFTAMGNAVNVDLSNYDKDLSNATSSSVGFDKQLRIFDEMKDKMTEIFNSK